MSGIPNHSLHSFITSYTDTVRKIFIKTLFIVNSNDLSCVLLIGQASSAYNKHGIHLELINCRTTSSEEDLPILPKTALNARQNNAVARSYRHLNCLALIKYTIDI